MGEAFQGGRSDCGCAYEICSDLLNRFRGFCKSNPCISVGFLDDHTSARFKSHQFLKVVSGGRAPGKSSIFSIALIFKAYICSFIQGGKRWLLLACCCLPAAACLLACLPAACCLLLLLAAACCCLLLLAACLLAGWLACWLAGWLACCLLAAAACLPGWIGQQTF